MTGPTGAFGPIGPTGPTGLTGISGPAGAPGFASAITVVANSAVGVVGDVFAQVTAVCPAGMIAAGAGFSTGSRAIVMGSYVSGANASAIVRRGPAAPTLDITSYVICVTAP
jgi:hypothetical protein